MNQEIITPDQWFDQKEFENFANELNEEVSVKTRMKLAIMARRTAKRRAFLTKIRAKKRKGLPQLRKRARNQVRAELKRRIGGSNWSKMSYGQRKRLDDIISKKRKFVDTIVKQVMPKVYKGESERLKRVTRGRSQVKESFLFEEKTKSEVRASATDRKRKQRARESELRQIDPAKMAFVVRDTTNNRIMIVDKNSFEKEKHAVLVKPENMTFEVAKQYAQDPNFKNTVTSQRILGTKVSKEPEITTTTQKNASEGGGSGEKQVSLPFPSTPIQDTTQIDYNVASWSPIVAINALKGISVADQVKNKMLTPEQAELFNTSENIQQFAQNVANDFAESFFRTTGRTINEYNVQMISKEPSETSAEYQKYGVTQAIPTTDVLVTHLCVSEKKNACENMGVSPEEQMIRVSIKYGTTNLYSGKLNLENKALFMISYEILNSILSGQQTSYTPDDISFSDSDKESIDVISKKLDTFFKDKERELSPYSNDYDNSVLITSKTSDVTKKVDDAIGKIKNIKDSSEKLLQDIFSTSRLFSKIFFDEMITGKIKFANSPNSATHILAINPDAADVKFETIDENLVDQLLDSNSIKINVGMVSTLCNTDIENLAFAKTVEMYNEASKEIPLFDNPLMFCGKMNNVKKPVKEARFKYSILGKLFENEAYSYSETPQQIEKEPTPAQKTVMQKTANSMIEMDQAEIERKTFEYQYYRNQLKFITLAMRGAKTPADRLQILFSLFNSTPNIIEIIPIDFYDVLDEKMGAKINPIIVNGKQKMIRVINTPVFDYMNLETIDNPMESYHYSFAKQFLAERRKARDYSREYEIYHSKPSQKKDRAGRNKARRRAIRKGIVSKGDGKDIDHKNKNPRDNRPSNLRVRSKSENRADHR